MATTENMKRMRDLGRKARRGEATEAEVAELSRMEHELYAGRTPVARSIFDLPIAREMWAADAREIER